MDHVGVSSGAVVVVVKKSPLLVNLKTRTGKTNCLADEPSSPMAWNGPRIESLEEDAAAGNCYGLGDKPGTLNRRNRAFTFWNTDSLPGRESTDPLYKTIPFFIGLNEGTAYGIFFDNTYRSNFNFGLESPDFYSFGSEGGEMNSLPGGPGAKKIVQMFAALTATRNSLLIGLSVSSKAAIPLPEARVREIAKTFRDKKIPCDAIYLDIDYQKGNAPFTVDRERFPTFEQMIKDLATQNFHTVLIVDLHIKKNPGHGYAPYDTGIQNDAFVKKADGSLYVGNVWPGASVFPDFTLTRVRTWWGGLFYDFVNVGVAGFWNDMNEPALFLAPTKTMPLDNLHRLDDGTTLEHRAVHNFYGMENVRATYDGLRTLRPNERPFRSPRAAYAGTQRYAATWTGDNISTWNHLRMSTPLMLNLGISAYPLVGTDIGGFAGSPTPELLTRWIELGVFNPIYRDTPQRTPPTRSLGRTALSTKPSASATSNFATACCPTFTPPWRSPSVRRAAHALHFSGISQATEFYGDEPTFLAMISSSSRWSRRWWTRKKSSFLPVHGTIFGAQHVSLTKTKSCSAPSLMSSADSCPRRLHHSHATRDSSHQ